MSKRLVFVGTGSATCKLVLDWENHSYDFTYRDEEDRDFYNLDYVHTTGTFTLDNTTLTLTQLTAQFDTAGFVGPENQSRPSEISIVEFPKKIMVNESTIRFHNRDMTLIEQ